MNFEEKKKIVESGSSKILQDWQKHSSITKEQFLEALEWVCADPCNGGYQKNLPRREVGLTPTGYKKLIRVYEPDDSFKAFYEAQGLKKIWRGADFNENCDNPEPREVSKVQKISINCKDSI